MDEEVDCCRSGLGWKPEAPVLGATSALGQQASERRIRFRKWRLTTSECLHAQLSCGRRVYMCVDEFRDLRCGKGAVKVAFYLCPGALVNTMCNKVLFVGSPSMGNGPHNEILVRSRKIAGFRSASSPAVARRRARRFFKRYGVILFEARKPEDYGSVLAFNIANKFVSAAISSGAKNNGVVVAESALECFVLAETIRLLRNGLYILLTESFSMEDLEARKRGYQIENIVSMTLMFIRFSTFNV
ncbi:hypothetical protein NDN08_000300 [Rhodosorus marinus]|uniref:Uncharacterized protein n=1 Tax=Rhodosorus marinus TaxID=101924 RepID=A0AAV8UQJ7_9RHOD|nr:hypothetical protein NDN08_000300 [Rhodosorus marinus]